MHNFHNNWRQFLAEDSFAGPDNKKLLREIDEDEYEHIRRALDEMGPEDLAFNEMFGGKNRILIPFPITDTKSELGQFIKILSPSSASTVKDSFEPDFGSGLMIKEVSKTRKERIKIGKWLAAVEKVVTEALKVYFSDEAAERRIDNQTEFALKTAPKLKKLLGVISGDENVWLSRSWGLLFLRTKFNISHEDILKLPEKIAQLRKYWQQNADYIKKNSEGLKDEDTYSILLTRHPVDILRMSDFDDIESCHSPPSRGGESEYYKCAVAEAHGHGALAYVVQNDHIEGAYEDLLASLDEPGFEGLVDTEEFQKEEVLWDEARSEGLIEPIQRLRLRQIRYYDNERPARYDEGTELAIPELATYGTKKIPGFRKVVADWAKENQAEAIKNVPTKMTTSRGRPEGAHLNLDRFIKFGGSYEDNKIDMLTRDFLDFEFYIGNIEQNEDTENQLDRDVIFTRDEQILRQAEDVLSNYRLEEYEVEIDVDEGIIVPKVWLKLGWPRDEWTRLPTVYNIMYLPQELEDYGGIYAAVDRVDSVISSDPNNIILKLRMSVEGLSIEGQGYFYDEYDFSQFIEKLDSMEYSGRENDSLRDAIKLYLQRKEWMAGGVYMALGRDIEYGDLDSYEWDLEVSGEYPEYELISATTHLEFSYADATKEIAEKIVNSRDFWIELRKRMLEVPQKNADSKYFVSFERFLDTQVGDLERKVIGYKLNFHVDGDEPDDLISVFKEIIEHWNDEDQIREFAQDVFNKFIPKSWELTGVDPEQDLNEDKTTTSQSLFEGWRKFLNT